jgi:predicted ATP-dependent serine protease
MLVTALYVSECNDTYVALGGGLVEGAADAIVGSTGYGGCNIVVVVKLSKYIPRCLNWWPGSGSGRR